MDEISCHNLFRIYANRKFIVISIQKKEKYMHLSTYENIQVRNSDDNIISTISPNNSSVLRKALAPRSLIRSLKIFRHRYFYVLFFSFSIGIGSGVLIISQTTNLWEMYTKRKDDDKTISIIQISFSIANAIANLSGVTSDFLSRKRILTHAKYIGMFMGFGGISFLLLAILFFSSVFAPIIVAILLISVGFGFGTYLVLFPIVVGEIYGYLDFGKYFGFLQIGSSTSTVLLPILAGNLDREGTIILFAVMGVMMLFSFVLLSLVRPQKYDPQLK